MAPPRLQPIRADSGGLAAGDGARRVARRSRVPGGRGGRLARHERLRSHRVPGGRVGRRVRAARRAPLQRAAQLSHHAVGRLPPAGRLCIR